MASRPPIMPLNETESTTSRITREGKQITYKLNVMQQPERARACGAGAKSSADRRPVDPPPVVELRIFESDPGNDTPKTDITFAYNANFFLYATLENARHTAGRTGASQTSPVLTGVPVAGVAYLDRPSQAGYFIFPDLSVRHEGRYRLVFHLYEEIKDVKDADRDSTYLLPNQLNRSSASAAPGLPQAYLNFRIEVKTVPFMVYSAKKFPGLATSTSLSRIIAEQGCRVRIRRDVRMRRRGEKREEEYDYDEERNAAFRPPTGDRFTPDRYAQTSVERPRSNSNNSNMETPYGFGNEIQRRPSLPDYGFPGQPPYQRPMPPAPISHSNTQTPSYQSHLSFGSTPSQYPAPHMPPTPPPVAPAAMYSPQTTYANIRNPSIASEYDASPAGYPVGPHIQDRSSYPKSNTNGYRMEPSKPPYMMVEPNQYHMPPNHMLQLQPPSMPPSMVHSLPSFKDSHQEFANVQNSIESSIPPSPSGYDSVSGKRMLYHSGPSTMKRSHEDSFGVDDRSMHNGMRPEPEESYSYRDFSGESRAALMAELGVEMAYKRANGRMVMKAAPPSVQ